MSTLPALSDLLQRSDTARRASRWSEAQAGYQAATRQLPRDPVVAHNLALCHLALGNAEAALAEATRALQLAPGLWQSGLVCAKALVLRGDKDGGLQALEDLHLRHPQQAEITLELARLLMQHGGDAARARALVRPLIGTGHHRDAWLIDLAAQFYDRDAHVSAQALSDQLREFADRFLTLPPVAGQPAQPQRGPSVHRPRVGLLSPQFTISPVYFFTIGALRLLAQEVDLVFISRGSKHDLGTQQFKELAKQWEQAELDSAEQLAQRLARLKLDVLVDLGGWMDVVGLQALSSRPARRQFKWVGGQSSTTGLRVFDGYFTDRYQSPPAAQRLHSEPLVRLASGYVTYTPPPYLPAPRRLRGRLVQLGVISNPAKVSRGFLAELRERLPRWRAEIDRDDRQLALQFIDRRYSQPALRQRIEAALPGVPIHFITPERHRDYLDAVSRLDATVDTWPYTGGLTTIEALAVGVPALTRAGSLFSERHTAAHCQYAGMRLQDIRPDAFGRGFAWSRTGRTLLAADNARCNHAALAEELLVHLRGR